MRKCILLILSFLFLFSLNSCSDSSAVKAVKNGYLSNYPNKTIGSAIDNFFGNPSWKSGIGSDGETKGETLVNVKGNIMYQDKKIQAELQFIVNNDTGSFSINALEFNGIPQNKIMIFGLIQKMYQ